MTVFLKNQVFLKNIQFLRSELPEITPFTPPEWEAPGRWGWQILVYDRDDEIVHQFSSYQGECIVERFRFEMVETGCGSFALTFNEFPTSPSIDYKFRVEIYLFGERSPRYAGHVLERPKEGMTDNKYEFRGHGLYYQLETCRVNTSYEVTEIGTIVRDIMINWVQPFTDIRYIGTQVITPLWLATELNFDRVSAKTALTDCAEYATNYVIGVDADRGFYFKPLSTDVTIDATKWIDQHSDELKEEEDISDIINELDVLSGELDTEAEEGATNYALTVRDLPSQALYGIRWEKQTIPSALSLFDAIRWGNYWLSSKVGPVERARIRNVELFNSDRIEAFGYMRYTNKLGQERELPIKRVRYIVQSTERARIDVDLGDVDFAAVDEAYVDMLRRIKDEENLQQSNVEQLAEIPEL
jgi:hypothetical protein